MPISERPADLPRRTPPSARDQSPAARAAAQAAAASLSGLTPPPTRPAPEAFPPPASGRPAPPPTSTPEAFPPPAPARRASEAFPPAAPARPAAEIFRSPAAPAYPPAGAFPPAAPATPAHPAAETFPPAAPATPTRPAAETFPPGRPAPDVLGPGTGSLPRRRPSPYSNPPTGELFGDTLRPDLRPDTRPDVRPDVRPEAPAETRTRRDPREISRAPEPHVPGGLTIPVVAPALMPPPLSSPPDEALTPFPLPPAPQSRTGRGAGKGAKKSAKPKRAIRRGGRADSDPQPEPQPKHPPIDETFLQAATPEGPPRGAPATEVTPPAPRPADLDATTTLPATRRRRAEEPSKADRKAEKKADKKADKKAAQKTSLAMNRAAEKALKQHEHLDPPVMPGETSPKENPHGRAGRNLPAAIGVGVGLAALTLASLFTRPEAFVALVSLVVVLAVWELAGAMAAKQVVVPVVPLAVGSLGMLVSAYVAGEEGLLVSFTLTGFGVLLWRIIDGMDGAVRDVTAGLFAAAYVPLLAGFAVLLLADDDGPKRVVVFILVTVASDIGGYATGVLFGKHPMAPTISPKKSWEGFAGSVVVCLVTGAVAVQFLLGGPFWAGLVLGGCAAVTATLGDLSESLLKRDLGVKDMGSLLPGHGGIMDRLDSLLPTAPIAFLLLHLLVS